MTHVIVSIGRNAAFAALMTAAVGLRAQEVRKSQHGVVQQQIAGTTVTVNYNRPDARGRTLFGGIVPWGVAWSPGADSATSISFSTAVRVNGASLPAGTYSLWAEPGPDKWTLIFSRAYPVYHLPYPKGQDALRVSSVPRLGWHVETLTFYFPFVEGRHAELHLHWGTVAVPLVIDVPQVVVNARRGSP